MTEIYRFRCTACGEESCFMLPDEDLHARAVAERRRFRKGIYGETAQQLLLANRRARVTLEPALYRCGCGFTEAAYCVRLRGPSIRRYTVRRHCPSCAAVMSLHSPASPLLCRCGGKMEMTSSIAAQGKGSWGAGEAR